MQRGPITRPTHPGQVPTCFLDASGDLFPVSLLPNAIPDGKNKKAVFPSLQICLHQSRKQARPRIQQQLRSQFNTCVAQSLTILERLPHPCDAVISENSNRPVRQEWTSQPPPVPEQTWPRVIDGSHLRARSSPWVAASSVSSV